MKIAGIILYIITHTQEGRKEEVKCRQHFKKKHFLLS